MKTNNPAKIIAIAVAVAIAVPLSASARHHDSEDILAGAVIGCIAGVILATAADGECQYAPVQYAPPPPHLKKSARGIISPSAPLHHD